jgi:DNA invertase Pin-like site-specific DNA recombinase
MGKRAAIYARLSTDKVQTVESQLRELQAAATRLDWAMVGDRMLALRGGDGRTGIGKTVRRLQSSNSESDATSCISSQYAIGTFIWS